MRLAYADPPYPGKANRYPENEEVDHQALIERLAEYDGWALSTDETSLQYVLGLCPPKVRVLAWCRPNCSPFYPFPFAAWEPVICVPARPRDMDAVRSYAEITTVGGHMERENYRGQKPRAFCEWIIRCLGAKPEDTLDDLFPGSGVMGDAFDRFCRQGTLAVPEHHRNPGRKAMANLIGRTHEPLPGLDTKINTPELPAYTDTGEAGAVTPSVTRGRVQPLLGRMSSPATSNPARES